MPRMPTYARQVARGCGGTIVRRVGSRNWLGDGRASFDVVYEQRTNSPDGPKDIVVGHGDTQDRVD
eukprot:14245572-Alexandrium_andersonii.AAC.1